MRFHSAHPASLSLLDIKQLNHDFCFEVISQIKQKLWLGHVSASSFSGNTASRRKFIGDSQFVATPENWQETGELESRTLRRHQHIGLTS